MERFLHIVARLRRSLEERHVVFLGKSFAFVIRHLPLAMV
jgi:hypothetical protein